MPLILLLLLCKTSLQGVAEWPFMLGIITSRKLCNIFLSELGEFSMQRFAGLSSNLLTDIKFTVQVEAFLNCAGVASIPASWIIMHPRAEVSEKVMHVCVRVCCLKPRSRKQQTSCSVTGTWSRQRKFFYLGDVNGCDVLQMGIAVPWLLRCNPHGLGTMGLGRRSSPAPACDAGAPATISHEAPGREGWPAEPL